MIASEAGRPQLMGVLNVTPDSFSDGGRHLDAVAAVRHGVHMAATGADLIDVGGESTRPGATRVGAADQLLRVLPVIRALASELPADCRISIDTTRSEVAAAALAEGATIINDVSAGRDDPGMFDLARQSGVDLILMHMQGLPQTMQDAPHYDDVVREVRDFLLARARAAETAGVSRSRIAIDPGIGFGKTKLHNLQLIAGLNEFVSTGYPVVLGASRKRFMGSICNVAEHQELIGATCATTALGVLAGVRVFRVHDITENRQALDVAWAIAQETSHKS
ncbi:MAG: dihydropteroate synthase [Gammaproteobacteria bacterium]|nr:dihydropteroate synthase [Gammaproteobacteria bacterium]